MTENLFNVLVADFIFTYTDLATFCTHLFFSLPPKQKYFFSTNLIHLMMSMITLVLHET